MAGDLCPWYREVSDLYVAKETLECAQRYCRPCCYKIVIHGKGLLPNKRPEQCPRFESHPAESDSNIGLYDASMRILTVGDGDFSFSHALAKGLGEMADLVATSHESRASVLETYPKAHDILNELNKEGIKQRVLHGIDATSRQDLEPLGKFNRIIWNFPCIRMPNGADGQNQQMEENKRLIEKFFTICHESLTPNGQVHIVHKTKGAFAHWNIVELAEKSGPLKCHHRIIFDRCFYPGYSNKKVLSRKSFPIWDSQTFIFAKKSPPMDENRFIPMTRTIIDEIRTILTPKCPSEQPNSKRQRIG